MTTEKYMDEVKAMRPMLLSVARGILGSDEEAEDVVQDAMLRLWQLRDEPICNVRGFARVVVRNLSRADRPDDETGRRPAYHATDRAPHAAHAGNDDGRHRKPHRNQRSGRETVAQPGT